MERYGIVNYDVKIQQNMKDIIEDKNISDTNKNALNRFLDAYKVKKGTKKGLPVSKARKALFLKHIKRILADTKDIKKDMQKPELINKIFARYSRELSSGYYGTVVNITLRFVTWLNDGTKPKGFRDIDNISKEQQKRNLQPDKLWEWDDALKHSDTATRTQEKAWAPVRVEAGLRAAEFLGLNYGDVKKDDPYRILKVDGKTGPRDVLIYKSVPVLDAWLEAHPTKKDTDPLWVMYKPIYDKEGKRAGQKIVRYTYAAINKQFRFIAKNAGIDKPCDFNALRHSAARLSKIEGMNPLQAAENFGHTLGYYQGTYGKLSNKDRMRAMDEHNGRVTEDEKKKLRQTLRCERCGTINPPGTDVCKKCTCPLTLAKALEQTKKIEEYEEVFDLLKKLKNDKNAIQKLMQALS